KNPDLSVIRALAPDLVLANIEENRVEDVAALRAAGLRVWVTYPRTVAEALTMIRDLGEVTGARERARALLETLEPLYARARRRGWSGHRLLSHLAAAVDDDRRGHFRARFAGALRRRQRVRRSHPVSDRDAGGDGG